MRDKELERKLKKDLLDLTALVTHIGPTPLRQLLDAHLVVCYNALATFDQEAYEHDMKYARKCDAAKDKANSMAIIPWSN